MKDEYQFPELTWMRGSTLSTCIGHGLHLREKGRWLIPDYQRPLVWTEHQKIRFVESLIYGLPVGEYTLHENDGYIYEVLDGQQRWNAIFCYVDGEFPVFGYRHSELNEVTKRFFDMLPFAHRSIRGLSLEQRIDAYERLAYGGTPHEPKESA